MLDMETAEPSLGGRSGLSATLGFNARPREHQLRIIVQTKMYRYQTRPRGLSLATLDFRPRGLTCVYSTVLSSWPLPAWIMSVADAMALDIPVW